ncbi:glucose-6-phosphate 1-epimerase [Canna indica]|uniref:glucose-6-phosphate 1-epimerase n=1 Tax=Canna indica TaxID=4628 RepID=A0AAQ3KXT8_9LILI|nr:glucose-6-phosphate 1-epimerase [Canna indica]
MATSVAMASSPLGRTLSPWTSNRRLRRRSVGIAVATLDQTTYAQGVKITEGNGGLPKVNLVSSHGSEAEIYLFGGCVTSWKVPNGKDLLFVRPDAVFNGKKPISGGIPHCFPQFGPGPMQQHGFARNMSWSIADSDNIEGDPILTLELRDDPYSRSMWDFSFQALYKIRLHSNSLYTVLTVTNTDKKPFSFTTALHTYFHASITGVSVKGLKGCKTLNKDPDPSNPLVGKEEREVITFPGFVDCVYLDAPQELQLDNGLGDVLTIQNTNWSDAVLWNPYLQMEACYRDFVCVENAKPKVESASLFVIRKAKNKKLFRMEAVKVHE